ncbi:MAG: hypothetical protein ACXVZL_06860, partial [Gaiellaceae bacterium]
MLPANADATKTDDTLAAATANSKPSLRLRIRSPPLIQVVDDRPPHRPRANLTTSIRILNVAGPSRRGAVGSAAMALLASQVDVSSDEFARRRARMEELVA